MGSERPFQANHRVNHRFLNFSPSGFIEVAATRNPIGVWLQKALVILSTIITLYVLIHDPGGLPRLGLLRQGGCQCIIGEERSTEASPHCRVLNSAREYAQKAH